MMKETGILTFHRAVNYGAALQAIALKEKISFYTQTEIINYICPYIENYYKPFNKNLLKGIIRFLLLKKRDKRFEKFVSKMSSEKIYNKVDLHNAEYEKIIVGSDQVWNYGCSGADEAYLLPNVNTKKYSYAASFGVSELPKEQVPIFKECLSTFRFLSVREKTGKEICKKQLGLSAEVVLDPTLLLTKREWADLLKLLEKPKGYVLMYSLDINKKIKETAKKVSKQLRLPIYNITISSKDFFGNKTIKNAGPKEWVELFYNATFIVTDSFHGTAFSVNFNKPFYSFANNERASRIVDLLDTLGLQKRLNVDLEDINAQDQLDYISVNEKLEEERKKSNSFIEKIIND